MDIISLFFYILIILNIIAFLVMMIDKLRSTRVSAKRISEGVMFFVAAIGGSLGIYLGMIFFRHKTRKWYFMVGLPLIILQNAIVFYWLYTYLLI